MTSNNNYQIGFAFRPVAFDFASKQLSNLGASISPRDRKRRLLFILASSFFWVTLLIYRLVSLQITNFSTWQDWAVRQHFTSIKLAPERGRIMDRNDRLLAVSVPAGSVYIRPSEIKDKEKVVEALSDELRMERKVVRAKLQSKQPFVWVKRQVPRQSADGIKDLHLPGVGYVMESRRYYPFGRAASALIGKSGIDGEGLSGLERQFNDYLTSEHVETKLTKDAYGNFIDLNHDESEVGLPRGDSLKLTLDAGIQVIVDDELDAGRIKANSKRAYAVMMDADTGEVLSMSQSPNIDFNRPGPVSSDVLRNQIIETVYEPGSTLKPLIMAAAIDSKLVKPEEIINCEGGSFSYGSHMISDVHPYTLISAHDVIVRSSNIGIAKIGIRLGERRLYEALKRYGFGEPSGMNLPGESRGILRPVESWAKLDVATHSFGQGIAVTPLQILRATSAIANGGILPNPSIVKRDENSYGTRILSESTAAKVREMMYDVVENEHGTGGNARILGIRVGGKTGTAQKAKENGRGYAAGSYIASFVGFVDATELGLNRRLALIVVIDEPRTGTIYGGTLAAPVFKRIMQRSLYYLLTSNGITPKEEKESDEEYSEPRLLNASYGNSANGKDLT